ncbi:MAG: adenosylcobinamide amidohydrolase [Haloarculaceae archaeon]
MFEAERRGGVCQLAGPGARWLVTGPEGGYRRAGAAYNVSVPEGFDREDPAVYAAERRRAAGFEAPGPGLLTGVDMRHARGARADGVCVVATAGLSNPVALAGSEAAGRVSEGGDARESGGDAGPGTVNLLVGTGRALADGTLATLLATVVETKAATLQAATGFTGTTTDAVAVGCDPEGDAAPFAGSATPVGRAARACVRRAVEAAVEARGSVPDTVAGADHGAVPATEPNLFRI